MKKILVILVLSLIPMFLSAQAQVETKRYILSDFTEKPLKVVHTGNQMFDIYMKEALTEVWHLSPYEFCDSLEFERCKISDEFYFLVVSDSRRHRELEPGIKSLLILKGKDSAKEDLTNMYKVVSLPLCPADDILGKECNLIPAFLDILQNEVETIMKRPINPGIGVGGKGKAAGTKSKSEIFVCKEDLGFDMNKSLEAVYEQEGIHFVDADEMIDIFERREGGELICFAIAPGVPTIGSVSYTMIIDTESHRLIYKKSHKINNNSPKGISQKELRSFIGRKW
ncbi:MAG: hypothetical protein MJY92_05865 [Bacteroidales bacterium]|nr:hypothetical protein [Bacteroidales bacterium]